MAREGISAEEVAAAADALVAEGVQPSQRAVRERLGSGSLNTIQRHLSAWRSGRQSIAAQPLALPPGLMAAIGQELERVAAQARAEIEARLVLAQREAAELAAAGEAAEADRAAVEARMAELTRDNDTLQGKVAQLATDVEALGQRVDQEQKAAEAARVELAKARLQVESSVERASEQIAEIKRLRDALSASEATRTAAEQQAAVAAARLEEVQKHYAGQQEAWTEARKASAQEAHRQAERLTKIQAERDDARQAAAEARESAARMSGQLEALLKPIAPDPAQGAAQAPKPRSTR